MLVFQNTCWRSAGLGSTSSTKGAGVELYSLAALPSTKGRLTLSFDLFINDLCPKCRKHLKPAWSHHIQFALILQSTASNANCGAVKTKVLFRKQSKVAACIG